MSKQKSPMLYFSHMRISSYIFATLSTLLIFGGIGINIFYRPSELIAPYTKTTLPPAQTISETSTPIISPTEIATATLETKEESIANKIKVTIPLPDEAVKSPLTVSGEARGTWYFEASFPIELVDTNGKRLAVTPAQAQSDWMTENFVPFTATLTWSSTSTTATSGVLILHKDNPSGLPEHDEELRIPVKF